jgi:hypothetical protein
MRDRIRRAGRHRGGFGESRQVGTNMRRTSGSVLAMDDPVTAWSRTDRPRLSAGQAAEILRIGTGAHAERTATDAPDVEHRTGVDFMLEVSAPQTLTDLAAVVGRGGASITLLLCAAGLLASGTPESGQLAPHGAMAGGLLPRALRPAARAEPDDPGASLETSETRSMQKQFMGVAALGAALAIGNASHAQAVQWRIEDGGNGHWYQLVSQPVRWVDAEAHARALAGYLATITSPTEHGFVSGVNAGQAAWLGGYQAPDTCEPGCGWAWVTGESWDFAQWDIGQPDNAADGEHWLQFHGNDRWNDNRAVVTYPFIVEWSADCNDDGIVDYGQCRDGSLPDYNGNNIPDCCEQGTACVVDNYPIEWRQADGGNGHWYKRFTDPQASSVCWAVALDRARTAGGDLLSVTSPAENEFVTERLRRPGYPNHTGWIGLTVGESTWSSGEPLTYTNWYPGQPSGDGLHAVISVFHGMWNDIGGTAGCWPDLGSWTTEWSGDCNDDGIIDFGQILRGELSDSNTNGVPDVCEDTIRVPQDRPTIQSAIDSVPVGQPRLIVVAPGTYPGPIDFMGRDVVVRGAGHGLTIIQGSGGQVSAVVRFSGSEPATAGLERCTVRGGLTGSPIPQAPQFLVGGGLFASESSANVRDCVFEDNFASYGGGAYLRNSTTTFERCTFRMNRAGAFGGGLQFLNSQGVMIDCIIQQNTCESRGGGLHVFNGTTTLTRVSITGNSSTTVMGGISFDHAGDPSASLQLVDCTVTGNTAAVSQGGIGVLAAPVTTRMSLLETTVCANVPRPNISGPWQDLGGNTVCICVGDLTGNDFVNGDDLGMFLAAWGPCVGEDCPADFNDDGVVDGIDLGQLLAAWGPCPN